MKRQIFLTSPDRIVETEMEWPMISDFVTPQGPGRPDLINWYGFNYAAQCYNNHFASLPLIAEVPSNPGWVNGQELVEGKDFEIVKHVSLLPNFNGGGIREDTPIFVATPIAQGDVTICPSCGNKWNTKLYTACECGATIEAGQKEDYPGKKYQRLFDAMWEY